MSADGDSSRIAVALPRGSVEVSADYVAPTSPWAVAAVVRLLHRGSWVVDIGQCAIDWTHGSVAARGPRRPLSQDRERRDSRGPGKRVQPGED